MGTGIPCHRSEESGVALGLSYCCSCGEHFKIYGEVVSRAVDWEAVGTREDGEVDDVKRVAETTGCTFIDARKISLLRCPECMSEVDLVDLFRARLIGV
jgi:hypothetical protein